MEVQSSLSNNVLMKQIIIIKGAARGTLTSKAFKGSRWDKPALSDPQARHAEASEIPAPTAQHLFHSMAFPDAGSSCSINAMNEWMNIKLVQSPPSLGSGHQLAPLGVMFGGGLLMAEENQLLVANLCTATHQPCDSKSITEAFCDFISLSIK